MSSCLRKRKHFPEASLFSIVNGTILVFEKKDIFIQDISAIIRRYACTYSMRHQPCGYEKKLGFRARPFKHESKTDLTLKGVKTAHLKIKIYWFSFKFKERNSETTESTVGVLQNLQFVGFFKLINVFIFHMVLS